MRHKGKHDRGSIRIVSVKRRRGRHDRKKRHTNFLPIVLPLAGSAIAGGAAAYYLYLTPYELHAEYKPKNKLYENDVINKNDFNVYTISKLGRIAPVEKYRLNNNVVSQTGLVAITSEKPHMGVLVDLKSIPIASSEIVYNQVCYEDHTEDYKPQVAELIHYEDGKTERVDDSLLDIDYKLNKKDRTISIDVEGFQDDYETTFDMIKIEAITTNDKVSIQDTLSSDMLDLTIHYSDDTEVNLDKQLVTSDTIETPQVGTNQLSCYYNEKEYQVAVEGFDPDEGKPRVTFPGYGTILLEYSKPYYVEGAARLNTYVGVRHFNNHRETFYTTSEPGGRTTALHIPGKHIAEDGTVRDADGFICVASDFRFHKAHEIVLTTLGPGKVYDNGCRYGTVDLYVNW